MNRDRKKEARESINNGSPVEEALHLAIDAIDRGDLVRGKAALGWVLQREPANPVAWAWLACCAPDEQEKDECYKQLSRLASYP